MTALFNAENGYGLLYTGNSDEVIEVLDSTAHMLQEYDLPGSKEIFIMSEIGPGATPPSEYFSAIPEENPAPLYLLKPNQNGNIAIPIRFYSPDTDVRTLSTEDILDWVVYQTVTYDITASWPAFSSASSEQDTANLEEIKAKLIILGKHKSISKANIEKKGVIMLDGHTSDL